MGYCEIAWSPTLLGDTNMRGRGGVEQSHRVRIRRQYLCLFSGIKWLLDHLLCLPGSPSHGVEIALSFDYIVHFHSQHYGVAPPPPLAVSIER
jgi:hypothetical protein